VNDEPRHAILAARGDGSSANGNGAAFGTAIWRGPQVVAARGAEAEAETFGSRVAKTKAEEEPQRRKDGENRRGKPERKPDDVPARRASTERLMKAEWRTSQENAHKPNSLVCPSLLSSRARIVSKEHGASAMNDAERECLLSGAAIVPTLQYPETLHQGDQSKDAQDKRHPRCDVEPPAANDRE
jgi:hypothetical protein